MSSGTLYEVIGHAKCPIKDIITKGHWNQDIVSFDPYFNTTVRVDTNVWEHGEDQNVRCLITVKDGKFTVKSFVGHTFSDKNPQHRNMQ